MRILVVDDDAELREALGEVLEDAGFTVLQAADGAEALAQLSRGEPPDAILLDVRMPRMDGWHFLSARLREPALAATPVILMSAMPERLKDAHSFVCEVLPKPIEPAALFAAIDRCRRVRTVVDEELERLHAEAARAHRVLLVDDDADTREVLGMALAGEGWKVDAAADGEEALAVLRRDRARGALPSVIVCDLRMPVMDGWRFWLALRQDPVLSGLPLVIMSGHPYELDKLGPDVARVRKPVDLEELRQALRAMSR